MVNWATSWTDPKEDDVVYEFRTRMLARSKEAANELGVHHKYVYMNYADAAYDDVFAGYDEANLERMKEIQRSIDPEGVFTKAGLCTGHFKLL